MNQQLSKQFYVLCGKEFMYTLGELNGEILSSPRGENGFGYDPIFEVNGKTLAEMTLEEKSGSVIEKMRQLRWLSC